MRMPLNGVVDLAKKSFKEISDRTEARISHSLLSGIRTIEDLAEQDALWKYRATKEQIMHTRNKRWRKQNKNRFAESNLIPSY